MQKRLNQITSLIETDALMQQEVAISPNKMVHVSLHTSQQHLDEAGNAVEICIKLSL